MTRISEVVLNFVLNSAWQVVVIAAVAMLAARLLRNGPARYRHALWCAALILSVAAPIATVLSSRSDVSSSLYVKSETPAITSPANPDPGTASIEHLVTRRRQVFTTSANTASFFAIAYVLFIVFRLIRFTRLWRRKELLRRSILPIESTPGLDAIVRQCRNAFGLSKVTLGCSPEVLLPATLGARQPLIVLPEDFCSEIDEEALLSILGHEMAHVARRDFVTNLIGELVSLPVSFHPLTFLIKRQISRTRELACDELVTERLLGREAYARALVSVANTSSRPLAQAFMLSIFDGNILEERIMRLTQKRRRLDSRIARPALAASLTILGLSTITVSSFSFDLRSHAGAPPVDKFLAAMAASEPAAVHAALDMAPAKGQIEQSQNAAGAEELAQAACAAGRNHDVAMIPKLILMLGDDRKIELVRCWQGGRWSPALDTFKQPSPGEQAAIALASMGTAAYEPLTRQLSNSNRSVRRNAAWAIGELTEMLPHERAGAVPQLISLLSDSDEWVRMAAARALGEVRDARAGDNLIAKLGDSDWRVRELAAWALSEMKDERAVTALCATLLSDGQVEVRRMAAEALGEIRNAAAIPSLKQALNDSETRVRAKAGWAISEIEDSDG